MTKLTDKEILDFVRDNLTLDKNISGAVYLGKVSCNIIGDVDGDVGGGVYCPWRIVGLGGGGECNDTAC